MAPVNSTIAVVFAIAAAGSWGVTGVLSKFSLGQGTPILIVFLQLGASVLISWILATVRCNSVELSRETCAGVMLGVLHPGLSNTLGIIGLAHVDASVSSTLWALEGPFTLALAAFVLAERLTGLQVVFSLTSLVGVFLLSTNSADLSWTFANTYGVSLILIAVLCCALYAVGCRQFPSETSQQAIFAVSAQQTLGLATCAALWPFHWSFWEPLDLTVLTWTGIFACVITGPLSYLFATGLFVAALRYLPASYAGGFLVLTPVFGLTAAYMLLGEKLTAGQWAGVLIVLMSVLIAQISSPSKSA